MNKLLFLVALFLWNLSAVAADDGTKGSQPWAIRIAESFLIANPDTVFTAPEKRVFKWNYDQSPVFEALYQLWQITGDRKYFTYMQRNLDYYLDDNGKIKTYTLTDYNIDNIASGRQLLYLHKVTGLQKYKTAVDTLRKQLRGQPRTHEGGFWHKKIYPYQMWLDGLYMGEPFYAIYATYYKEPEDFDDIARQFIWMESHSRDSATGLLYHGWDESRQQRWADPLTGRSPQFWGRAMGWYMMALVDVLDYFPLAHPRRQELIAIFQRSARALRAVRDPQSHLWWQVVDKPGKEKNYWEASASAMFTYAFAKGANKGYLDKKFTEAAQESFNGLVQHLVTVDEHGAISLHHICQGAGLGGQPYRDGSYEYYVNETQRTNDLKGLGPFLLAAIELERELLARPRQ